jgi:hypothetical protein
MSRSPLAVLGLGALTLSASLLAGCDRDSLYTENRFSDNVYLAYEECSESEIRFLTAKHNLQTAFEPCGSNNFVEFAWAPDGIQLYFQLPMSAHIMNGEDKSIGVVPTEVPSGDVAWLASDLLVLPLSPETEAGKPRLVLFDRVQASLQTLELSPTEPQDLQSAGARDKVYFTALDGGQRRPFLADFSSRTVDPAFPWLEGSLDSFTFSPELDQLAVGREGAVDVYTAQGELVRHFDDALRASLHAEGRYIAIESIGEPISPFDQRTWNEMTDEARERELRRMNEWLDKQPEWVLKEVRPPVIDIFDGQTGQRLRFSAFYGDRFQWYPSKPELLYASFVLWGLEGKEMNRNVALTQLHERLRMAAQGELPLGMEPSPGQSASLDTPPEEGG